MNWWHAYRNGVYVSWLFEQSCYEAIKAKQFGKWALRRRACHDPYRRIDEATLFWH